MEVRTLTAKEVQQWFRDSTKELNVCIELLKEEALKGKTKEEKQKVEDLYLDAKRHAKTVTSIGMPDASE